MRAGWWFAFALPLACGQAAPTESSISAAASDCAAIASGYHDAVIPALACDPAAQDACTAWRPVTVAEGSDTATAKITGLCWVASVGYVSPQQTPALDAIVARYTAAGCSITYCPGPAPHVTQCARNTAGQYTCGGN